MPMQRKRAREPSVRYHYRFLERHDLLQMCQVLLVSSCLYMFHGMQGRRGLQLEEIVISGMLITFAASISIEAQKKRRQCRPPS